MRLFTALDLPADMLLGFERFMTPLRPEADIKWSPLDNLHITTKFIGEWTETRLDELDLVLRQLPFHERIEIKMTGLAWYPNADSPRVLLAPVDGGQPLHRLAAATEHGLAEIDVKKESRPYYPHLTLARIKSLVPLERLKSKVEELQSTPIGTFPPRYFCLYRSEAASNASVYLKLRTYPIPS